MKAVYKALAAIAIVPIGWTSTAAAQPNEKQKAFVENSLSRLNLSTAKTVGLQHSRYILLSAVNRPGLVGSHLVRNLGDCIIVLSRSGA